MGGTTVCMEGDSLENLLKKMLNAVRTGAEKHGMFPDSDLVVKDEKGKEYVFEALVSQKAGWVKPLLDFSKNTHYRYFYEQDKFSLLQVQFLIMSDMNGKDPEKEYPILLKWRRKYVRYLFKKAEKKMEHEGGFFAAFLKYHKACNKGRFEVMIYPKQFKHPKNMLANLAVEEIVAHYYKEPTGKFFGSVHLHS